MKILFAWLGMTDIRVSKGDEEGLGPIGQAVLNGEYAKLCLLSDQKKGIPESYCKWLTQQSKIEVNIEKVKLTSPTSFSEIYEAASSLIEKISQSNKGASLVYHLSPGTPAMAAVWIILAKTKYPAELVESSKEAGVKIVSIPFDISADYLPELASIDSELSRLTHGLPPQAPEFSNIIHKSESMKRLIAKARRVAVHDVPVLIQGETGTGKELLARAIHFSSTRKGKPFVAVNCGAIPDNLFESEFFGYKKGAFTGATSSKSGYLEDAHEGTLFLDEVGELPLSAQVKLLRVLQEGKVSRLGDSKENDIDVRIIAATNRNLIEEVSKENFREDLFHRLALGILHIPSLKERKEDLGLLIDHALQEVNKASKEKIADWKDKKISANARNLMLKHSWPGNVRELLNTISRAVLWTSDQTITEQDMEEAILPACSKRQDKEDILNQPIDDGIELKNIIARVAKHYIERALKDTHRNKTEAAKILGLPNYQTLSNWMERYGVK